MTYDKDCVLSMPEGGTLIAEQARADREEVERLKEELRRLKERPDREGGPNDSEQ